MKNKKQKFFRWLLKSVRNFFSRNLLWKLFSLCVAVFLWFIVMNTINPTEVKTFQASVSLENMSSLTEQGYMISNLKDIEDYSVTIRVEATRPALDELSKSENRNNIRARIDLSRIEINENDEFPKTYSMVVAPSLPSNLYTYSYNIYSYYPTVCEIEVDKAVSKTVPIEIRTDGTPASGYLADDPVSDVTEVTVTGPQHIIDTADKVVAVIDITGEKQDVNENCELIVYDENDTELEGFIIEPESVNVSVNIRKNHTVKIDEPRTVGSLPDYLELVSVDWSPKSIDVISEDENAVESVSLPVIDLTQISGSETRVINISDVLENSGLEAESGQENITVTINVKLKSGEKYTIPAEAISITGLGAGLEAEVTDDVTVEIGGVDNVNVLSLMPSVDLSGLGEGTHSVTVTLSLPVGSVMSGTVSAEVNITRNEDEITATETETESTTVTTESTTVITESEITTETVAEHNANNERRKRS